MGIIDVCSYQEIRLMKTLEFIKRYWKALLSGLGAVIGYLVLRQQIQKGLKAELQNQKTLAKDDVLNERKSRVIQDIMEEQAKNEKLREGLNKPVNNDTNWDEVEDFYKKRK
jgi:hypothetical protein